MKRRTKHLILVIVFISILFWLQFQSPTWNENRLIEVPFVDERRETQNLVDIEVHIPKEKLKNSTLLDRAYEKLKEYREIKLKKEHIQDSPIPKIIHQQGKSLNDIPYHFKMYMDGFKTMNPEHTHLLWTNDDLEAFVQREYPQFYDLYMSLPMPVLQADLARYFLLNTFGGIYSDMDTQSLKSFKEWPATDFDRFHSQVIVGIEVDTFRPDWEEWFARSLQFCQWTMATVPHHPITESIIAESTKKLSKMLQQNKGHEIDAFNNQISILNSTGPGIWTDCVFKYIDPAIPTGRDAVLRNLKHPVMIRNVTVLPITGFSPGQHVMGSEDYGHPEAKVAHLFNGGWKKVEHRNIHG